MNAKSPTFETQLSSLEKIVRRLEQGDLSLEESLKLFEDGVKLSRECQERLSQAERRIEILLKDGEGNPALRAVGKEDLKDEALSPTPTREVKAKRRIVFEDDEDEDTPF